MAFGADALETRPIFAGVKGLVDHDFRVGACGVGAGDNGVTLVQVSVC